MSEHSPEEQVPAEPAFRHPDTSDGPAEQGSTESGAPTDEAHQASGDGSLTGSVPAGLTPSELDRRAAEGQRDDPGAE